MTTYTINVTQDDIDNGVPDRAHLCPIAKAVNRDTGGRFVSVGSKTILTVPGDHQLLPDKAVRFIRRFDNRRRVKPFTFELDLP